jgi:hypothetical protein
MEAVASLSRADVKTERLIRGAALHDIYHAGQITMLKRLMRCVARPAHRGAGS